MSRRSPGAPRTCPDCGITGAPGDTDRFLSNGSTRCRDCSRELARRRYPQRRAAIAETRRQRRELLRASADDGNSLPALVEAHKAALRVRYWVRYGTGDCESVVGHPWRVVAEMLERNGLDREGLGTLWELDLTRGLRLEDWKIDRL